ncbi:hypothetical protein [Tahibacter harae]|uniref:Cytochrome c family protein n=1 Tax=Tahibacter harae TaxID=2963937 RepID=A0ABT1QL50_9GAMM|nr:hypothetical protein [Tahibacter harae]MCQ4163256.1 hypothetical protein [Tahibacter harae]
MKNSTLMLRSGLLALAVLGAISCSRDQTRSSDTTPATPATPAAPAAPATPAAGGAATMPQGSTSNCLAPPTLNYTVPKDFALTRQADANCFAWQQFLALNWVAASGQRGQPDTGVPASQFGDPNDERATVWETYKESDEVFLADAKDPGPWNSWAGGASVKLLGGMKSETAPEPELDLSAIGQASQGSPWLTAQSGILTLYERRMNEDEYNYIVKNKLYNANVQQTFVKSPGISLPDGTASSAAYGSIGAIETKAAWLELPNAADWPRYKISKAVVTYPGQKPKQVIVGLVGLHIIHKTALGQQFIWATFEHRDNVPSKSQVAAGRLDRPYTYYNPNCNPATDYYKCVVNANPAKVNGGKNPYNAPIQAVRETDIPTRPNNDVAGLNQYVWSQVIAAQNPDSVYLNYELVNTLWSNQNTTIAPGSRVPLPAPQLSPGPSQEPVANTTMETYVQSLTCLACHASAAIATVKPSKFTKIYDPATAGSSATAQNPYAADYSFLLNNAQQPAAHQGNR